jgi:preprotein translocase subunit SecG
MQTLLLVVHVIVAIAIIALVMLQHGKGADMGAAFGGGASGSVFGATGSANFLSRATAILAAVFFATSLGLTWFSANRPASAGAGIMSNPPVTPVITQPVPSVPLEQAPAGLPPASPAAPASTAPVPEADKSKEIPN